MAKFEALLYLNDNLVVVEGLKDSRDDTYLNAATVRITLLDDEGTEVAGQSWPAVATYVSGSDGIYHAIISDTVTVVLGSTYELKVTADGGDGLMGTWFKDLKVIKRRG